MHWLVPARSANINRCYINISSSILNFSESSATKYIYLVDLNFTEWHKNNSQMNTFFCDDGNNKFLGIFRTILSEINFCPHYLSFWLFKIHLPLNGNWISTQLGQVSVVWHWHIGIARLETLKAYFAWLYLTILYYTKW